jgi:DNA-directed RNA polymerase specialized sigma subunit
MADISAKEFLSQAYRIDQRINSKLEQIQSLRELATKATATLTDAPPSGTRNFHRMEDVICKMLDLENEINTDICVLVDTKQRIVTAINGVDKPEYQTVLELRYLCYHTFWQIGEELNADASTVFRWHDKALNKITVPPKSQ